MNKLNCANNSLSCIIYHIYHLYPASNNYCIACSVASNYYDMSCVSLTVLSIEKYGYNVVVM